MLSVRRRRGKQWKFSEVGEFSPSLNQASPMLADFSPFSPHELSPSFSYELKTLLECQIATFAVSLMLMRTYLIDT